MMLTGRIFRESTGWSAHCEIVGIYTQGRSLKEATANLVEAIELKAGRDGLEVAVSDLGATADDSHAVFIDSNEPAVLAAEVLRYQREKNNLSLSDVAKKLGASSLNAYAAYEQGTRKPSLGKFRELLAVVAPDMVLSVGPRESGVTKRKAARR